ncbi:MAG TPA: PQQ-dependent sugar dehydrogenase [Candidatus Sulfotelmatobacter sp.]|jgi:glucose/arabinose dehydrogenase/mono/diheme cytochrome c family protein|nr:PQQ-dependent sugar dehydrogenase [Candidatus Sulfotelmatobacter sp.]
MSRLVRIAAVASPLALLVLTFHFANPASQAQNANFHNAPASAKATKNPYQGQQPEAARSTYQTRCAACHGPNGEGSGNIPALASEKAQGASDGELFWYITKGDLNNGMPAWDSLPEKDRWQIINYLRALGGSKPGSPRVRLSADEAVETGASAPPPKAPFTDYRYEKPGVSRKIMLDDLPSPFATPSAGNGPQLVPRPENGWPQVPPGFKVELYASGLDEPRLIRTAPNGDFFVAESRSGEIRVFRGITAEGKPERAEVFATGLKRPFGINFFPPGPDPQWIYVGNTDSVVRFPYKNGDLKARGPAEHIANVPGGGGHWTRDIQFTPDGKKMFVSVGSVSNVDDPDTTPAEKNRADVLEFNPDGSAMRVYAYGIRNCVGLAVNAKTGELWCSVNERDALGDNLVPDYITHVQEGGFYGWPWWYMGGHQDPRHAGKHPELKSKVITPDVILHPHNASLEMAFYDGKQFPAEYSGDIFAAEHGSWNKSVRVGYELIRVPLHQTGHATGEYEDFMTGFVVDNGHVWGRPVGVTVAQDGSLLVTDDGSKSIWRISYTGK